MTLPASGTITIAQIYGEAQLSSSSPWYNRGTSLGSYRGVQWWQDNSQTGTFPTGTIRMSDFWGKRSTTPVSPGSAIYYGSGGFTVPLYSAMTIVIRGGGGGAAGQSGNRTFGGNGGNGGNSYFGGYGAPGGAGGTAGTPGSSGAAGSGSDGTPAGGGYNSFSGVGYNGSGGAGGAGGKLVVYLANPVSGGGGPSVGSSVYITVGGGGGGGGGGTAYTTYPYYANLGAGGAGGAGYVEIYWS